MKLLHVISDPLAESISVNKRVAASFVDALYAAVPDLAIETVDLERDPPPYYGRDLFRFIWEPLTNPAYQPSPNEHAAAEYMLQKAGQLRGADLLLLSAPVWNYYLPAVLKAWIDQVLSPGQMFDFGADGRIPRHRIQAMVSVVSAGGLVSEQGVSQSLFHLLRETFRYAGIERHDEILIEGQEPALYTDHAEREAEALESAAQLATAIAAEITGLSGAGGTRHSQRRGS
jgi:FMN-dependent NADH-azoreductase